MDTGRDSLVLLGEIPDPPPSFPLRGGPHFEGQRVLDEVDRWVLNTKVRWDLLQEAGRLSDNRRIRGCSRYRHKNAPDGMVTVNTSLDSGNPFYAGLQQCGSVWACPVCSRKITEKRKLELIDYLRYAKERGVQLYMLTLTVSHLITNTCKFVLMGLLRAYKLLRQRKSWRRWEKSIGLGKRTLRALEVTYTEENGWHAHLHLLLFCSPGKLPKSEDLRQAWKDICAHLNLRPPNEHGMQIDHSCNAEEYFSKWANELTKSQTKRSRAGRGKGRTPFQLLMDTESGDERAGQLWTEYYHAFKGQKQLVYSRELDRFLGRRQEKSDEELANEQTEKAERILGILAPDWTRVLRFRARADVLIAAKFGGALTVRSLLEGLRHDDRELQLIETFGYAGP